MHSKYFRWVFYILYTITIPVIIFGGFEIGLRVAGYGYPAVFFKQTEINGKRVLINNRLFGLRFFPESLLRKAEPFAFSKDKPDGCQRIFVLGASAAQGDPDPTFGFSRILEVMLRRCYPTVHFEVINTAITAINSHVALQIAKDCCKANPDFLVLYLGNNEVVGPFGSGTMLTPVLSNSNVIRARIAVQSMRIGQLFTAMQRRGFRNEAVPESWGGMEMFLQNQIRSSSPALEMVYANYERNLLDMCRTAANSGASTILCTVPVNLKDSPPFASLHRKEISDSELSTWSSLYKAGIALEKAGDLNGAMQKYTAAIGIDSLFAEAHFRLARCLEATGQFDRTKMAYEHACLQDALMFRATKQINTIIHEISSQWEMPLSLADVERRFEALSAHEIPGRELFWDHVHLNFEGNYYAAQSVFFTLEKMLREKQSLEKTDSLPSLDQCAQEIVYSTWDEWHITSIMKERFEKPPFSNQAYHHEQMDLLTHEYSSLQKALTPVALDSITGVCRNVIERRPEDWRLRFTFCNLLEARRHYPEAIDNYQRILNQLPHCARAYSSRGAVFSLMGLRSQAIANYKTALTINPRDITVLNSMGVELAKNGQTAEAAECFAKAFHFYPQYLSAHLNYANILSEQNRFEEAKLHFDRALSIDSNHAITYLNYGMAHIRRKNYREARHYIEKAVALDTASVNALMTLGNLLVKLRDLNGSARQFERVLTIDPANAGAKACLGRLEKMGVAVKLDTDQVTE